MLISSLTFLTRCWPLGLFEILFNFLEISFINRSPHKIKTPPIFLFCCKFSRTPRLWVCCFVSPEGCTFVEKFQYSAAWWERHLNLCFYWTLRWSNDKSWVTNRKLLKSSTIHLLSPRWSDEAIGGKITKKRRRGVGSVASRLPWRLWAPFAAKCVTGSNCTQKTLDRARKGLSIDMYSSSFWLQLR